MQTVAVEEYVSCVDQRVRGIVYTAGEVVPGAEELSTLPALLRTNRMRVRTRFVQPDAEDIGSAQAAPKTPAEKRAATIAAKKATAEAEAL